MTPTLFAPADRHQALERLRRLRADTRPQWGKMNAAQMCAHVAVGLKTALGEVRPKRALIGILFGRLAKGQIKSPKPFGKNLPTGPEFIIERPRDFALERDDLVALIERFAAAGEPGLTREPHPFFGALSSAEWQSLMWKHLDHHLRQFGV